MVRFLLGMSFWVTIALLVALASGFALARGDALSHALHVRLGLLAAVLVFIHHAGLFAHLMSSHHTIKAAVREVGLDEAYYFRAKRFFATAAFPFSLLAPVSVVVTAIAGGAVDTGRVSPTFHLVLGVATLATNLIAFPLEIGALRERLVLFAEADAAVRKLQAAKAARPAGPSRV